jgi:hypothetical protein
VCVCYLYSEKGPLPFFTLSLSFLHSFFAFFFALSCFRYSGCFALCLSSLFLPFCGCLCGCFLFFSLSHSLVRPTLRPILFDWEVLVCFQSLRWMSTTHRSHPNSLLLSFYRYVSFVTIITAPSRNAHKNLSELVWLRCISTSSWFSPLLLLLFSVRYRHLCQI